MFGSMMKLAKRSSKGFTLIELLVVVVIVGILAAVALPNFLNQTGKARLTEADAAIDAVKSGQEVTVNRASVYASSTNATAGTNGTLGVVAFTAQPPATGVLPAATVTPTATTGLITTQGAPADIATALEIQLDTTKFGGATSPWLLATMSIVAAGTQGTDTTNGYSIAVAGRPASVNQGLGVYYAKNIASNWNGKASDIDNSATAAPAP